MQSILDYHLAVEPSGKEERGRKRRRKREKMEEGEEERRSAAGERGGLSEVERAALSGSLSL